MGQGFLEKLQDEHCDFTRTTSKRFRVLRNIGEVAQYFPEKEPIICIGSGDGFEVDVWKLLGFNAVGYDISSTKNSIARKHGVDVINIKKLTESSYNVYCAHTLEHIEDRDLSMAHMATISISTTCFIFPIEPHGSKNPSHISPIKSLDEIYIPGFETVLKYKRWNDELEGIMICKKM